MSTQFVQLRQVSGIDGVYGRLLNSQLPKWVKDELVNFVRSHPSGTEPETIKEYVDRLRNNHAIEPSPAAAQDIVRALTVNGEDCERVMRLWNISK